MSHHTDPSQSSSHQLDSGRQEHGESPQPPARFRLGSRPGDDAWDRCPDRLDSGPPHRPSGRRSAPAEFLRDPSIADCVSSAISTYASLADECDVSLRAELDEAASAVRAGPLSTVIVGALRRAIDSCRTAVQEAPGALCGHEVVVCVRSDGTHVHAHVLDNGASDATCQAWERTPTLALCAGIVRSLGGEFWFRQVPFGAGAILSARVPLASLRVE